MAAAADLEEEEDELRRAMAASEEEAVAEQRQLERAIAQSLQEAGMRSADARYEEDATLHGLLGSLRPTLREQAAAASSGPGGAAARDREAGRSVARGVLEAQLASGGGF